MQIVYPDSNRVGKFRIKYEQLRCGADAPLLKALFGLCVILETEEVDETGHGKMFYASSDLFEPLAEGENIPEYRIECAWPDQPFKNPDYEKDCIRAGNFRFRAVRKYVINVPPLTTVVSIPRLH